MNVKGHGADVKLNDPLEAPICSPDDCHLNTLLQFGNMALEMCYTKGKRVKHLSNNIAKSIPHTCCGTVELCKTLATNHDYVLLGMFISDHLEKGFGKLRQDSRGTYFINVQFTEKLHINHTSLLLSLNINIDSFDFISGHECASCTYVLYEAGSEIFDNLEKLESSLPNTTKMSLIYFWLCI